MTKVTKGTMTTKQILALIGDKKKREYIINSGKEVWTDEEVLELSGYNPFPRYPIIGSNKTTKGRYNAHIAEDDLVHSYDNNFEEWR